MPEEVLYKDFAIILTWPDATIRGDEPWMMFFKRIGLVKNLNFKVGHTGIIIIDHRDGAMLFYDFGRYITPRGYGRARSKFSDPLLDIKIKALFDKNGQINNMQAIIEHIETLKAQMYGEGRLLFSIVEGIDFLLAKNYGDSCVIQGTYPYGAVARNNNNCSRFITRMLMKSSLRFHFWHSINLPETIKSSPVSNLVNSSPHRRIYAYSRETGLKLLQMNRWQSFWFLIKQLADNVKPRRAQLLPTDLPIGAMNFKSKPTAVPLHAVYLGGVGDGAWYGVTYDKNGDSFTIKRFTSMGQLEYIAHGASPKGFNPNMTWQVTYDSHLLFTTILQNKQKLRITHVKHVDAQQDSLGQIQERYA